MIKRLIILIIILTSLILLQNISAQLIDDLEIKAVVIEQFSRFIEWDESKEMKDKNKPITIGVWGNSKFYSTLKVVYKSRTIKDKKVNIQNIKVLNEIEECDIIFICNLELTKASKVTKIANTHNILTITDNEEYINDGIHFYIYFSNNKIRFKANFDAIKEAKLKVDHLLLKLCEPINEN